MNVCMYGIKLARRFLKTSKNNFEKRLKKLWGVGNAIRMHERIKEMIGEGTGAGDFAGEVAMQAHAVLN